MSKWSDWGQCDTTCGAGLKNRTSKVKIHLTKSSNLVRPFFVTDYRFFGWLRSEGVLVQGHRFNTQRAIILVAISFGKLEVGRTALYTTRLRTAVEVQKPGRCVAWKRTKMASVWRCLTSFAIRLRSQTLKNRVGYFVPTIGVVSEWTSWTECKVSLRSIFLYEKIQTIFFR